MVSRGSSVPAELLRVTCHAEAEKELVLFFTPPPTYYN